MLADEVGTGKTFVALAVARTWRRPLVVAPASLRATWRDAMVRAGVQFDITSHEALSRGRVPGAAHDGIIVDESHRFRSTTTRRHAVLATLGAHARLLLLSATPLQNRTRDLAAQVALFRGARAFRLTGAQLTEFVVRSGETTDRSLPRVMPPIRVHPSTEDEGVLREIVSLPSPVAPVDGGDAGVLRQIALVRAWSSSRAALIETLRRRQRVATAIEQCLAAGLLPTRAELRAWHGADSAVQLGFASLLASGAAARREAARLDVEREQAALGRLLRLIATVRDPDLDRAAALAALCAAHRQERVLAFTEFASTARAYHRLLAPRAGVGLLTSRDARIASGPLPRDQLLSRFAPRARNAPLPPSRERVTLLITTDLLSEGVNLQDASVVVHLDQPWNPARLSQRVGRVRRPGGCPNVHTYWIAPPANAELLLDVEQRLRRKLEMSAAVIGRGLDVLPRLAELEMPEPSRATGAAAMRGDTLEHLARWRRPNPRGAGPSHPIIAGVGSETPTWIAALSDGRILAAPDRAAGDRAATLARVVRRCNAPARHVCAPERSLCMTECQRVLDQEGLARLCGREEQPSDLSSTVDRRIALTLRHAPRRDRATIAAIGQRLRMLVRVPRALGLERALHALMAPRGEPGDIGWMQEGLELLERDQPRADRSSAPIVVAMIVLGCTRSTAGSSPGSCPARGGRLELERDAAAIECKQQLSIPHDVRTHRRPLRQDAVGQ